MAEGEESQGKLVALNKRYALRLRQDPGPMESRNVALPLPGAQDSALSQLKQGAAEEGLVLVEVGVLCALLESAVVVLPRRSSGRVGSSHSRLAFGL